MPRETREVRPGPKPRTVRTKSGEVLTAPEDWALLPPGDAGLTRRVKAGGPSWTVKKRRGRREYSQGVWAPARRIERARAALNAKRATPQHQQALERGRRAREKKQDDYALRFHAAVVRFLNFPELHQPLCVEVAKWITDHAIPVGSGTVARTQRISLTEKARAATMAWLRHHTTPYDSISVPRRKGARREVRARMAKLSKTLLERYRSGEEIPPDQCKLRSAIRRIEATQRQRLKAKSQSL